MFGKGHHRQKNIKIPQCVMLLLGYSYITLWLIGFLLPLCSITTY